MAGNQLSQLPIEILILSDAPIKAQVSQLPIEILVLSNIPVVAQLSQLPIEILVGPSVAGAETVQFVIIV